MVGKALSLVANSVETRVIEDAGHWIADENPRALTQTLIEFLG
jgi:hypothetical protein